MSDSAKVVRLNPEAQRAVRNRLDRLPTVGRTLHEKGRASLQEPLQRLFDEVDDALFNMADKASTNQDQNAFFEAMREIRVQRASLERRFLEAIDESFGRLMERNTASDSSSTLSLENLSLVMNDDLEQVVAMEAAVRRCGRDMITQLTTLCDSFNAIVAVPVDSDTVPLGPQVLASAFMGQIKPLDADIRAKLLIFKLFDRHVLSSLPSLYAELARIFAQHGIRPHSPAVGRRRVSDTETGPATMPSPSGLQSRSTSDAGLIMGAIPAEGGRQALLDVLSFMQKLPATSANHEGVDIERLLESVEHRRGQPLNLGGVEQETMRLVQMLFEFILQDKSLAKPMREQLSRLQVPVLKVALMDESFLTDRRHVARRLINEISAAALGCAANGQDESMLAFLRQTVERVVNDFDRNIDIFKDTLTDFTDYMEKEQRRATILERRTVDAEDGKAKTEMARAKVTQELERCTRGMELPGPARTLIFGPWSNVLFVSGLKFGFASSEWTENLQILSDLVWSVQHRESAAERQQLLRLIPDLVQKLRGGLDAVAYNPFEVAELMTALEEIHLARIRGETVSNAESAGAVAAATPEEPAIADVPTLHSVAEQPIGPASIVAKELAGDDPHMLTVAGFAQGSWFDLTEENGDVLRCRLAATIKATGKYIFVNRAGLKVAERSRSDLAWALKKGALQILDNSMLFDRALESIVSMGRNSRNAVKPDK